MSILFLKRRRLPRFLYPSFSSFLPDFLFVIIACQRATVVAFPQPSRFRPCLSPLFMFSVLTIQQVPLLASREHFAPSPQADRSQHSPFSRGPSALQSFYFWYPVLPFFIQNPTGSSAESALKFFSPDMAFVPPPPLRVPLLFPLTSPLFQLYPFFFPNAGPNNTPLGESEFVLAPLYFL